MVLNAEHWPQCRFTNIQKRTKHAILQIHNTRRMHRHVVYAMLTAGERFIIHMRRTTNSPVAINMHRTELCVGIVVRILRAISNLRGITINSQVTMN